MVINFPFLILGLQILHSGPGKDVISAQDNFHFVPLYLYVATAKQR